MTNSQPCGFQWVLAFIFRLIRIEANAEKPDFDRISWDLVAEEYHAADERHELDFTFRIYERRS